MAYIINNSDGVQFITGTGPNSKGLYIPVVADVSLHTTSGIERAVLTSSWAYSCLPRRKKSLSLPTTRDFR